jgi:hypothetical protein
MRLHVGVGLIAVAAVLVSAWSTPAQAVPSQGGGAAPAIDSQAVTQSAADQQRWLSLPDSRIVLNPTHTSDPGSEPDNGPTVPMGYGYWVDGGNDSGDNLVSLYRDSGGSRDDPTPTSAYVTRFPDTSAWTGDGVSAATSAAGMTLTVTASSGYGDAVSSSPLSVNLTTNPLLTVDVPAVSGGDWALKINNGGADIPIQQDTAQTGTFTYDLTQLTGLSGQQQFKILLFASKGQGNTATFSWLTVHDRPAFSDTFSTAADAATWNRAASNGAALSTGTAAGGVLNIPNATYGYVAQKVTINVSEDPILSVDIPSTTGKWAIKLNTSSNGGGNDSVELQHDSSATGHFDYDIASISGWTGSQTFWVKLYEISTNSSGSSTTLSDLSIHSGSAARAPATANSNQWFPDRLAFSASYSDGSVSGYDTFHDVNAVTRLVNATGLGGGDGLGTLTIAGDYSSPATYDAATKVVTISQPKETIAIALPSAATVQFYPSDASMQMASGATSTPGTAGAWSADVPGSGSYAIGIGFAVGSDAASAVTEARAAATVDGAQSDDQANREHWNSFLSKVPHPSDFSLHGVQTLGVTPGDVESMYYQAFIDLEQNVLPVMPESSSHQQIATGKASLYNGGPTGANASASWDSLLGMQDMVYVDPDLAWDAYDGMMAAVASDGSLGGESLPARKAQTAWVLYQATGDRDKLAAVYPALKRNLAWEQQNPRWNYGGAPSSQVDAEFVASLIVDYGYAEEIATTLGDTADVTAYKQAASAELQDYENWFFPGNGVTVYQHYTDASQPDDLGLTMYVATGLHILGLPSGYVSQLENRFLNGASVSSTSGGYDLGQQLAGLAPEAIKAPDEMYLVYGLLDQGMISEANGVINSLTRDIVRTGTFAEVYQASSNDINDAPLARSVYPSLFGIANLIDNVWMQNGFRADQGNASVLELPGTDGGVAGLSSMGKTLNISVVPGGTPDAGVATVSGSAIASSSCTFPIANGKTLAIDAASCKAPSVMVSLSTASVAPGGNLTVSVKGLPASTEASIELHSTPVTLATVETDSSGSLVAAVRIPANTAVGSHSIVVTTGAVSGSAPLTVVGVGSGASGAGSRPASATDSASVETSLAHTGTSVSVWAVAAAILLLLGGGGMAIMSARRRNRPIKQETETR